MSHSRRNILGGSWLEPQRVVRQEAPPKGVFWLLERIAEVEADADTIAQAAPWNCLVRLGTICRTCVERCPEPGALTLEEGPPVIDADKCTGCAACAKACPAPAPALRMVSRGS